MVPDIQGPTMRYPGAASPGCWEIHTQLLVREYGELKYPDYHRVTVDAYMVQHPGLPTPQTVQSVNVHLIALCAVFDHEIPAAKATQIMQKTSTRRKHGFHWLTPPASPAAVTVSDVVHVKNEEYQSMVMKWGRAVWDAWREHHGVIEGYLKEALNG